ncbi:hypothetical protein [Pinirhizobacter sp.]|uniref:hypothetical protein n=1 Tax=Pinirhizobacter sp. TaxID=2950432 RepID=UPI002F4199D6
MKSSFGQRFLVVYSGVLTAVFAVTVLSGFVGTTTKKTTLDELTVQRINVVEPDGTLRMVISNKATEPGLIIKSKEHPHPTRSSAGILFYNDEGTENGGLMFDGKVGKDGQGESSGHLSFDEYEQDQAFVAEYGQKGGKRYARLVFADNPDMPMSKVVDFTNSISQLPADEQSKRKAEFMARNHYKVKPRMVISRLPDESVMLGLNDTEGRPRIRMQVAPDGTPSLQMLDDKGKVISQMPTSSAR